MNIEQCKELFATAARPENGKPLCNNTRLYRRSNGYAIRLYDTDVVLVRDDGAYVLNSGGWRTVTTKDRINTYGPSGWRVWSERGVWYLGQHGNDPVAFDDGITIHADGRVSGAGPDPKATQRLAKRANEYCRKFTAAMLAGEVPAPSTGDCWYCGLREVGTKKPLGELTEADHILSHIKEGHFVPSLLARAVECYPISDFARALVSDLWAGTSNFNGKRDWIDGIAKHQLGSSLRRYVRRQLGLAS